MEHQVLMVSLRFLERRNHGTSGFDGFLEVSGKKEPWNIRF